MYRSILLYIIFLQLITYSLSAKLVYNCKSVHFDNRKYKDINVVFMTGFEILKNVPYEQKLVSKVKKYAVVILSEENMMIVELDDPTFKNKSSKNDIYYKEETDQEDEFISYDANKVQGLTEQNNLDGDAFFYEYKTNCRLEFTKSCLKDAGNSILYGRDLENKHIVKISPNQYMY